MATGASARGASVEDFAMSQSLLAEGEDRTVPVGYGSKMGGIYTLQMAIFIGIMRLYTVEFAGFRSTSYSDKTM